MADGVGGQTHGRCWYSLVTLFSHIDVHVCTCMYMYVHVCTCMYMYVHVCTDDIHSLQFTMQIFIGKVYMGKYVDKQGKARTPSSSLIIAYNIECIGEGQWLL